MTSPDDAPLWIAAPACPRDACFSLPAVRALAEAGPVGILAPETQSWLWQAAAIGEIRPIPEGSSRQIRPLFDGIHRVLLWEAGNIADAAAKAGVRERVGLPAPGLARRLTRPLERVVQLGPPEHDVRRFLDTATLLGAGPFEPRHFAPLAPTGARTLHLAPGSSFGSHFEWPLERWSELLDLLAPDPAQVRVVSSEPRILAWAADRELATIDPGDPGAFTAGLFVSADSPLPHLAAAMGTTCAVLYGPGDPALHRPLGKQHAAIRRKAECSPCFASKCVMDLRCQLEIEAVRAADLIRPMVPA